jgi:hypothetical protein
MSFIPAHDKLCAAFDDLASYGLLMSKVHWLEVLTSASGFQEQCYATFLVIQLNRLKTLQTKLIWSNHLTSRLECSMQRNCCSI